MDQADPLLRLDFEQYFPHKFWISSWSRDESYPDGFRYKLLSSRDVHQGRVDVVLALEQADGQKSELHRATVAAKDVDHYVGIFLDGLVETHGIEFEEQDFTPVRSSSEFDQQARRFGWTGRDLAA